MIRRTTASPMPGALRARREERVEDLRAAMLGAIPGPLSDTAMRTRRLASARARIETRDGRARAARLNARCGRGSRAPAASVAPSQRRPRGTVGAFVVDRDVTRAASLRARRELDHVAREGGDVDRFAASGCRGRARSIMSVTRWFRRAASRWMISQRRRSSSVSPGASRSSSIEPEIDPSGFRISCARPAAMRPSIARRSAEAARSLASSSSPPVRRRRSAR